MLLSPKFKDTYLAQSSFVAVNIIDCPTNCSIGDDDNVQLTGFNWQFESHQRFSFDGVHWENSIVPLGLPPHSLGSVHHPENSHCSHVSNTPFPQTGPVGVLFLWQVVVHPPTHQFSWFGSFRSHSSV